MESREYDEMLANMLLVHATQLEDHIKEKYHQSDEKPLFYKKLLQSVPNIKGDIERKPDNWPAIEAYLNKKTRGPIKINGSADDIKGVLKEVLTVDRVHAPVIIRNYYELSTKRDVFYKELLTEAESEDIIRNYTYKGDAIRQYCREQLKETKFWKRNDWANTKWIATSALTIAGVIVSLSTYLNKSGIQKVEIISRHDTVQKIEIIALPASLQVSRVISRPSVASDESLNAPTPTSKSVH